MTQEEFGPTLSKIVSAKYLSALLIAVTLVMLLFVPSFLPLQINMYTYDGVRTINSLPTGSIWMCATDQTEIGSYNEARTFWWAFAEYMCESPRSFKFVFVSTGPVGPLQWQYMMRAAKIEQKFGYKYGVDYVIFPFLPGDEMAMAATTNFYKAYSADVFGNKLEDLPLMQRVKTFADVDAFYISTRMESAPDMWVRQWAVPYPDKPLVSGAGLARTAAYYGTFIDGDISAYAQFEKLVGKTGEELTRIEASNAGQITVFVLYFGALVVYRMKRLRKAQPAKEVSRT